MVYNLFLFDSAHLHTLTDAHKQANNIIVSIITADLKDD